MNKIIIFIVVFTTFTLYSQKKDSIIVINPFGANKYPLKNNRYGNAVKFKITNVNVFKLTGGLNSRGETPVFEIPKIFKEANGEIEEEGQVVENNKNGFNNGLKKIIVSQNNFIKHKNNFIRNLQKTNDFLSLEEQLKTELKDSIFIRDVTFLKKNTKAYYNAVFEDKNVLDNLKEVDNTIRKL